MTTMVALLLADGFEEIEALTPIDVLRRAGIVVRSFSINGDYCVCGAHDIMVDADDVIENIDYDESRTFVLKEPTTYVGTDGTPIGLSGGAGWNKVPSKPYVSKLIATPSGTNLNVTYEAGVNN